MEVNYEHERRCNNLENSGVKLLDGFSSAIRVYRIYRFSFSYGIPAIDGTLPFRDCFLSCHFYSAQGIPFTWLSIICPSAELSVLIVSCVIISHLRYEVLL